jgi:hypothetical protein
VAVVAEQELVRGRVYDIAEAAMQKVQVAAGEQFEPALQANLRRGVGFQANEQAYQRFQVAHPPTCVLSVRVCVAPAATLTHQTLRVRRSAACRSGMCTGASGRHWDRIARRRGERMHCSSTPMDPWRQASVYP